MIEMIPGLPEDVLGVYFKGRLTHEDYSRRLVPAAEEKIGEYGKIRLLYMIDTETLEGVDFLAVWDDTGFGLKHWFDISHIAIVTDVPGMKGMAGLMAPLFPGEIKLFSLSDLEAAKVWISKTGQVPV